MPLRNLTVIFLSAVLSLACYLEARHNRYVTVVADAMYLVDRYYLEKADRRDLFENAMGGMIDSLDQYSAYIGPEVFQEMEASLDQEFGGIGVEVEKADESEPLTVLSPIVGTPAYRAGMRAGDAILEIDGSGTRGMDLKEAVRLMRGKPGSSVLLSVLHAGERDPLDMTVVREVIVVDSVLGDTRRADGSWDFHLAENPRIGYLRVTTFGKHTVEELTQVLRSGNDKPFEGLILDLRGNAGGLLDAAVATCDLFVEKGLIVSTRGRDGKTQASYRATKASVLRSDLPMAIVVNKYSASASEIVAACLQDHGRAVVVGARTWGKGTVQNLFELEGGRSALKLTTAGYMRPSGKNIHKRKDDTDDQDWGVLPDEGCEVVLPDEEAQKVFLQRRQRDIVANRHVEEADTAQQEDGGPDEGEPVDDRQLRRAIEHIEQQLRRIDAKARTA